MIRRAVEAVRNNLAITAALLVLVVLVIALMVRQPAQFAQPAPSTSQQLITMDPRVIANLTQLPKATPLAGQEANDMNALQQLVEACAAYDAARREQMIEQIGFILNPAGLSGDVILALGADPRVQLLEILGSVTANRWLLDHKPADSCLIPIGKRINQLLIAAGADPVAAFVGG